MAIDYNQIPGMFDEDYGGFFENEPRRLEGVSGVKIRKRLSGFWGSLIESDINGPSIPEPPKPPKPPKTRKIGFIFT